MEMIPELRTELTRLGWKNPESLLWGEVVDGSVHHVTLRLPDGKMRTTFGPFNSVRRGKQLAIIERIG